MKIEKIKELHNLFDTKKLTIEYINKNEDLFDQYTLDSNWDFPKLETKKNNKFSCLCICFKEPSRQQHNNISFFVFKCEIYLPDGSILYDYYYNLTGYKITPNLTIKFINNEVYKFDKYTFITKKNKKLFTYLDNDEIHIYSIPDII